MKKNLNSMKINLKTRGCKTKNIRTGLKKNDNNRGKCVSCKISFTIKWDGEKALRTHE